MQTSSPSPSIVNNLYVGPYKLEKTLGKGQTGEYNYFKLKANCLLNI